MESTTKSIISAALIAILIPTLLFTGVFYYAGFFTSDSDKIQPSQGTGTDFDDYYKKEPTTDRSLFPETSAADVAPVEPVKTEEPRITETTYDGSQFMPKERFDDGFEETVSGVLVNTTASDLNTYGGQYKIHSSDGSTLYFAVSSQWVGKNISVTIQW